MNEKYKASVTMWKAFLSLLMAFGVGVGIVQGLQAIELPDSPDGFTIPIIMGIAFSLLKIVKNINKNWRNDGAPIVSLTKVKDALLGTNFLCLGMAGAVGILVCGCATTPDSIKELSVQEMQMMRAIQKDAENVVDAYDDEVRHWVELAFKQAMVNVENDLIREDGSVILVDYKERVREVAAQMGASVAEYDQNKADILGALAEKFDKALLMMMLIDEYERSTGTSPETWAALSTELGGLAVEVQGVYDQHRAQQEAADAANRAANPTLQDRFTVMGHGIFDALYERVIGGINTIGTEPVPEPTG